MSYRITEKSVLSSDGVHTLYGKVYIPTGEVRHYHFFGEEMPYPILKMEKRI